MTSSLISVLMPVHNGGEFLTPAVESILSQEYQNLELILVDDHSTDQAINGLPAQAVRDPRLRILSCRDHGIVSALNTGADAARGSFLARMDDDDISLPHRLGTQIQYFRDNPDIGIAASRIKIFGKNNIDEGNRIYQEWLNKLIEPEDIGREIFIESPLPHPSVMFRREIFEKLGGYRNPPWPEDYDMWLRAHEAGIKMGKPEDILLHWREHENRLTRTSSRYSNDAFLQAKGYYLSQSILRNRSAVIWGAGTTGILMHDILAQHNVHVEGFIDVNPRLIGGTKRGLPVFSFMELGSDKKQVSPAADKNQFKTNSLILGAVASRGAREKIRTFLSDRGYFEGTDFLLTA